MFQNVVTLTGATQFAAATPVATFLEFASITTLPSVWAPRIFGYSYNSLGTAATVTLRLSVAAGSAINLQIALETPTTAVNDFTHVCGRGGVIVPRQFGLTNDGIADQTLDVALGLPENAAPLVLLFTTAAKDDTATFRVWWDYVELGGSI
jgi:hypothetical protein